VPRKLFVKRVRFGLLGRVAAALVAVGLIPLAVVPFLLRLNHDAMTEQVLRTHAVAARASAARVEAFLEGLRRSGQAAARNPQLADDPRAPAARALLAGLLQAEPLLVGAVVVNRDGGEVIRVQDRMRAGVVDALLAPGDERPLVPRREAGGSWIRLVLPLPEGRGELRLVADASPLADLLRADELGREAVIAVATERDGVIAASAEGVTLASFPENLRSTAGFRLSGAMPGPAPAGEAFGAVSPVPGSGWFVLSRQPAHVAEEVARTMRRGSLLSLGAAVLLAAAVSGLAWRSVVRPVRELARAQLRLARRDPDDRGDEIEQLRGGLAVLERQTRDRADMDRIFLGRYLVVEIVGTGGMGTVFRGWDPKLQRAIALKTVRLQETLPAGVRAERLGQLLHEAVTVARFSHPNIVAVYDVADDHESAFIAMEFVDGVSLDRYLTRDHALPVDQAALLAAGIARGLAAAHDHGIVHRDVKPGNVLLGRNGAIKVSDFGVAGPVPRPGEKTRVVFGTPGYMAPECVEARAQPSPLGDLFSLGVILHECVSGASLFTGRNTRQALARTAAGEVPSLRRHDPRVPEELEALVMGLLQPDPGRRHPPTGRDVAERLERLAASHGWTWRPDFTNVPARPDPWPENRTRPSPSSVELA
jgi:HAMP domain-containing protein